MGSETASPKASLWTEGLPQLFTYFLQNSGSNSNSNWKERGKDQEVLFSQNLKNMDFRYVSWVTQFTLL